MKYSFLILIVLLFIYLVFREIGIRKKSQNHKNNETSDIPSDDSVTPDASADAKLSYKPNYFLYKNEKYAYPK